MAESKVHVADDFEVEEKKSWTQKRSEIPSSSRVSDNVRTSLQSLDVLQVAKRLAGIAADSRSHEHLRKSRRVVGMIHVLDELLVVDDLRSGKEAYELYSSAFEAELTVPDRTNFRDELLSSEIGLPVTAFTWNNVTYIVLNSESWNIVRLLNVFCEQGYDGKPTSRFDLDAEALHTILDSMKTEYDKSVVRAILAATSSRSEV